MQYSRSAYQFHLPEHLIAQKPCYPKDRSRLMVIRRSTQEIFEICFKDLVDFLSPLDQMVFNDTKVIPARLYGKRESGGAVEFLLSKERSDCVWEVLAKPGRKLRPGSFVHFAPGFSCEIIQDLQEGAKLVRFSCKETFDHYLEKYGQTPLPHYISSGSSESQERLNYQTIFAKNSGAVAAPTAGLHFTPEMFERLEKKGVQKHMLTLHVGLGTFRPVQTEDIREHRMHSERYTLSNEAADSLNEKIEGRRVCVGTTCCRVLETVADEKGFLHSGTGETDIFIYPGYTFKYVDCLLTNFHLPGSSLLMLVSAFAGQEIITEAYARAVKEGFRFYSYGDAMLIY